MGDNMNEDTRPIKLLSALLRAITKFLSKHYQVEISPKSMGTGSLLGTRGEFSRSEKTGALLADQSAGDTWSSWHSVAGHSCGV
jgi:hypothetical protein